MNRTLLGIYGLLAGLSIAVYYFIQNERSLALLAVYLGIYAFFVIIYFLRVLYYIQNRATLNELFFYIVGSIIPVITIGIQVFFKLSFPEIGIIDLQLGEVRRLLKITLFSFLAFPFHIIVLILLFRCFTRYKFIRWGPYSENGINAELLGFFFFIIDGIINIWIGWIVADFLAVLIGIFLFLSGITFIIAR